MPSARSEAIQQAIREAIAASIGCAPDQVHHFAITYCLGPDEIGVMGNLNGVQPTVTMLEQGIAHLVERGGVPGHYIT